MNSSPSFSLPPSLLPPLPPSLPSPPFQLSELQSKLKESEARVHSLSEQLRTAKLNLEAREAEITLLSREKEYWPVREGRGRDLQLQFHLIMQFL